MRLLSPLLLSTLTLTVSTPTPNPNPDPIPQAPQPPSGEPKEFPPDFFYLRTRTTDGQGLHNNLWVSVYHTGAGTNDVVVNANQSQAVKGYLNETVPSFDLGGAVPWRWGMSTETGYSSWQPVTIDAINRGTGGFFNKNGTLEWTARTTGFGGWMVCDWWHNVPQVFWSYAFRTPPKLPCGCADVDLVIVPDDDVEVVVTPA